MYILFKYLLKKVLSLLGYNINLFIFKKKKNSKEINLNIGAGRYVIDNFHSLDFYTPYYYKNRKKFEKERIHYDIRKDKIPFKQNTVSNIYISHVIEHIEDVYVNQFLSDSYRVLKKNGVLRIACPDANFLFKVSQFENNYWRWRDKWFYKKIKNYPNNNSPKISQLDYLMREISTPRCRYYENSNKNLIIDNLDLKKINYSKFKKILNYEVPFRESHPGDHISFWDFEKISKIGLSIGYSYVIQSKPNGSVSDVMQGKEFDLTAQQMSLYIDLVK